MICRSTGRGQRRHIFPWLQAPVESNVQDWRMPSADVHPPRREALCLLATQLPCCPRARAGGVHAGANEIGYNKPRARWPLALVCLQRINCRGVSSLARRHASHATKATVKGQTQYDHNILQPQLDVDREVLDNAK